MIGNSSKNPITRTPPLPPKSEPFSFTISLNPNPQSNPKIHFLLTPSKSFPIPKANIQIPSLPCRYPMLYTDTPSFWYIPC